MNFEPKVAAPGYGRRWLKQAGELILRRPLVFGAVIGMLVALDALMRMIAVQWNATPFLFLMAYVVDPAMLIPLNVPNRSAAAVLVASISELCAIQLLLRRYVTFLERSEEVEAVESLLQH